MRRVMFVENKSTEEARIGWVELSRTTRTYTYRGRALTKVSGYKYNCVDLETGEEFWVSGPRRDGADRLYGGVVEIDDDARVAYWTEIRGLPACVDRTTYRAGVSTRTGGRSRRPPDVRPG